MMPRLVGVAHGTRDPAGPAVVDALMRRVAAALDGVEVTTAYVELVEPPVADVLAASRRPTVLVPLLLSTGYHVKTDLPAAASRSAELVRQTRPLGPDRLVARTLAARLTEAGARSGDAVVLGAAGSSDPAGVADVHVAANLLRAYWGPHVTLAFLSAAEPGVGAAVRAAADHGRRRVFLASYLLAPGRFAARMREEAMAAGATEVTDVLGEHPLMVELVRRRYLGACSPVMRRGEESAA